MNCINPCLENFRSMSNNKIDAINEKTALHSNFFTLIHQEQITQKRATEKVFNDVYLQK